jgi:hypothetical protein
MHLQQFIYRFFEGKNTRLKPLEQQHPDQSSEVSTSPMQAGIGFTPLLFLDDIVP